jgi:tight adherence protein B
VEASDQTVASLLTGAAILVIAIAAGVYGQAHDPSSPTRLALARYVARLDRDLAFLRAPIDGTRVATIQGEILAVLVMWAVAGWTLTPVYLLPIALGVPLAVLRKRRDRRVLAIEEQLDTWMVGLSNALRATPALQTAIDYSARLVGGPLAEELDLVVKERELGTPLDAAMKNMADRVGSRTVRGVLAMTIIGRATGGRLPDILEVAAGQLREMARIEGVIRTKTAEGRGQVWVLAMMPFGMLATIHSVDEHFFDPLGHGLVGTILIGVALVLWGAAILAAKKILELDV